MQMYSRCCQSLLTRGQAVRSPGTTGAAACTRAIQPPAPSASAISTFAAQNGLWRLAWPGEEAREGAWLGEPPWRRGRTAHAETP